MVRIREPQRFPIGTRVANPLEGRTGEIQAYDAATGLYTLVYSDNHRDVLPASQAERYVIKQSEPVLATETVASDDACDSDPNQFLGATVTKRSTSYEGTQLTSSGHVTQYFPDIQRFRVLFSDGLYADMTLDDVKQKMEPEGHVSDRKRSCDSDAHCPNTKQPKREPMDDAQPLNTQKFESRKMAYVICRQVLRIMVTQKTQGRKHCSDKQVVILSNKDFEPKRALEAFVEADGLRALEKLLGLWLRLETSRPAALLLMKVLAMLPGVKEEHLRKTNIARTLRAIEKCSHVGHLELVYGDLAHWIIQKWAKTAMNRSLHRSARDLLLEQQAQIKRAGTDGQVHLAEQATRKATAQQKETARLEALRTSSPKVDETPQDPGDDVVVYLPQFNSLGSETLRRPVRQTQELESLAAKINREYEDSVRKHHKDEDEENLDGIPVGRIVFGKPQLMHFSQHAMVMDLFATTRSKLMDKGPGSDKGATGEHEASACAPPSLPLPNKTQAPKKSILKVRDQVLVPASQVTW